MKPQAHRAFGLESYHDIYFIVIRLAMFLFTVRSLFFLDYMQN